MRGAAFLVVLAACADPLTWGEVSTDLASAYCDARETCGYPVDGPICREHTRWHLCEPQRTCDDVVDWAALDALWTCTEALEGLDEIGCDFLVFYQALPRACYGLFVFDPGAR